MLALGSAVEYRNEVGRIIGRTRELRPRYDVMFAGGVIRPSLTEADLVIPEGDERRSNGIRSMAAR